MTAAAAVAPFLLFLLLPPAAAFSPSRLPDRPAAFSHRPSFPSSSSALSSSSSSSSSSAFLADLASRFQGDFDNYAQVVSDRAEGLLPGEGGGHEHIHCTLVPVDPGLLPSLLLRGAAEEEEDGEERKEGGGRSREEARLAAFYFDGIPERIFRFRLYVLREEGGRKEDELDEDEEEGEANAAVRMRLYTLGPGLEGALRALAGRPEEWVGGLGAYTEDADAEADPALRELPGCDVLWGPDPDPVLHRYAYGDGLDPGTAHHAVMAEGGATVPSQMQPGSYLRIEDELSLWTDDFWINDRGFDPDTGDYVYGNRRGVPYQMRRVTELLAAGEGVGVGLGPGAVRRSVTGPDLAWTLGGTHRTDEEYRAKMDAIGGPSTTMNARRPSPEKEDA